MFSLLRNKGTQLCMQFPELSYTQFVDRKYHRPLFFVFASRILHILRHSGVFLQRGKSQIQHYIVFSHVIARLRADEELRGHLYYRSSILPACVNVGRKPGFLPEFPDRILPIPDFPDVSLGCKQSVFRLGGPNAHPVL